MKPMSFETFTWTWILCAGILSLAGLGFLILRAVVLRGMRKLDRSAGLPCRVPEIQKMKRAA